MTKTPIAVLGIDLGKNGCSLACMDDTGAVVMRKRITRDAIVTFTATLPACIISMEACCGAHFLGRTLALYGHTIWLMSPEYAPFLIFIATLARPDGAHEISTAAKRGQWNSQRRVLDFNPRGRCQQGSTAQP